ncbi:UDP-N-acetylglucosamine 2-epimerase [Cellulosimicrobium sp. 22601]|uniref:UDP-N-acetylglucosamine 2-epimerase n=1 Tax=unclassified Cellulosimicrobium TaxID=2624466 RepID=UPI003F83A274
MVLVHHAEAWDSLDEVVKIMVESEDFDPIVVSIPRRFDGVGPLSDENVVHEALTARGVRHLRADTDRVSDVLRFVKALEPDIVIRQSQWDRDVDDLLAVEFLDFARLCLVPYETMNLVQNVPGPRGTTKDTAVDAELHRAAWLVFCANEEAQSAAVREGLLEGRQFRVVGHPKLDVLRAAAPDWPVRREQPARTPRPRVVWSSHHTIGSGWTRFGLFPEVAEEMLEWAREGDVEIVWMPHPALLPYTKRPSSPFTSAQMADWRERWDALENTRVVLGTQYAPVLAAADVMITDGLSMLVEFQVLTKPVVFLERSGHRPFTAVGRKVVEGTHVVDDVAGARRAVQHVLADGDELGPVQARNVDVLFGAPGAAERIVRVLREEIAALRASSRTGSFDGTR